MVGQYRGAVRIAAGRPAFVRAVQAALEEPAAARAARVVAERQILARSSWDAIAARMDERMDNARRVRHPAPMPTLRLPSSVRSAPPGTPTPRGVSAADAAGG